MSEMTREEALAHFGVKGMKWGQRKQRSSSKRSAGQRLADSKFGRLSKANVDRYHSQKRAGKMTDAKKALLGASAIVGALAVATVVANSGMVPRNSVRLAVSTPLGRKPATKLSPGIQEGIRKAVKEGQRVTATENFKREMNVMLKDIADAHAEQTRWMKANVPNYNPRENPFLPPSELLRLSHAE
jgi:hypothetical protein